MTNPATPERPTSAGMYDYYLGGTAHSATDQAAAVRIAQILPEVSDTAWANRGFLQRAVKRLAEEHGVRQFIDIGAGLPTQRNTHDVLAEVTPDGTVVYVDVDPVAVARGNELLATSPRATAIQADVRDPEAIFQHPDTRRLIDFTAPIGLLVVALLHFIPDDDQPHELVARYLAEVPSGSYLVLSHWCADDQSERVRAGILNIYSGTSTSLTDRSKTEIARFFDGLELLPPFAGAEPGLAFSGQWGAEDPDAADSDGSRLVYAAVARKP